MRSEAKTHQIAVVGAGLIGRTLARELSFENHEVTVFDSDSEAGRQSCGFTGAGMLAPYSELESCSQIVFELGRDALSLWAEITSSLPSPVFSQASGTLVVAHAQDRLLLARMKRLLQRKGLSLNVDGATAWLESLTDAELEIREPTLAGRFSNALYLPLEGQIDNRQLLSALGESLHQSSIKCHFDTVVSDIKPGSVASDKGRFTFDIVLDCRGLGAKEDIPSLRGVRGEIIEVVAPAVHLNRPVRLLHPRYPLYIVPRQNHHFLIGATSIESDDRRPITVQSALELLSATYSIDPGFADAHIAEFRVNCRPSLPDNAPHIFHQPGLLRVNGLYRHGFLVTPKLVKLISKFIQTGEVDPAFQNVFRKEESLSCVS